MENTENAIVFTGNTGVGKSYICNKIFQLTGSNQTFESSSKLYSITRGLQQGKILYNGVGYQLIDTPGFFDCTEGQLSPGDSAKKDGENVCKLVRALETTKGICAIVFIFVGKFDAPQKLWFDRILSIIGTSYKSQIILMHNKENQTERERIENEIQLQVILQDRGITYQPITMLTDRAGPEEKAILDGQIRDFLKGVSQRVPFTLSGLVVPEVCYEKEVAGETYNKEISSVLQDIGHEFINVKDASYYTERMVWDPDPVRKFLGYKVKLRTFVPRMVEEKVHVKNEITKQTMGVFQDVYRVRFDGTKDLKEIQLLRTFENTYGA